MEPLSIGDGFDSGDEHLCDALVELLRGGGRAFVTGAAGTGKTYLVTRIATALAATKTPVYVTASTGIAATLLFDELSACDSGFLKGPSTLHSAAILPYSSDPDEQRCVHAGKDRLRNARVVIIDEISMLDRTTFSRFLKRLPRQAGILAVGDFYQLPPVRQKKSGQPEFAFDSKAFKTIELVELTNVYRQESAAFVSFLESLRRGHCDHDFLVDVPSTFDPKYPVLYGTRREAAARNQSELLKIQSKSHFAKCAVTVGQPEKALKWFATYTRALQRLELKESMRVMCVQNMPCVAAPGGVLVNGDIGTLTAVSSEQYDGYGPEWVEVEFDRFGPTSVFRHEYRKKDNDTEPPKIIFEIKQFPLIPAYGLTVHKAQGMTLDTVNIDGRRINFAAGQVYVAMSRCRTREGLRIRNSSYFEAFRRRSVDNYYAKAPRFIL